MSFALSYIGYVLSVKYANFNQDPIYDFMMIGEISISRFLLLTVSMYFGILSNSFLKQIDKNGKFSIWHVIESKSFKVAILLSPFVLFITYILIRKQPDDLIAIFMSFQNGFFWESIIGSKYKIDENK